MQNRKEAGGCRPTDDRTVIRQGGRDASCAGVFLQPIEYRPHAADTDVVACRQALHNTLFQAVRITVVRTALEPA